MNKREVLEQIQEDIITYCEDMDQEVIDGLCQIVVDNFKKLN